MKIRLLLCALGVAALMPCAAEAGTIDAQLLGAVTAVLRFCSNVDPHDDPRFDRLAKRFLGGLPEDKVEAIRDSAPYRMAYRTWGTVLAESPASDVLNDCKALASN